MKDDGQLWWLDRALLSEAIYVRVGHHAAVENPADTKWYHSLENGVLSRKDSIYPVEFVEEWREACKNENVYQSVEIYRSAEGEPLTWGPFLVDVDDDSENLEAAKRAAKLTVEYYERVKGLGNDDYRIFFSGRKGFHVEVRPSSLGMTCPAAERDRVCRAERKRLREYIGDRSPDLEETIDVPHSCIRLPGSVNHFVTLAGIDIARRKIALTRSDLDLSTNEIVVLSQRPIGAADASV